jgi:hypothetical protein
MIGELEDIFKGEEERITRGELGREVVRECAREGVLVVVTSISLDLSTVLRTSTGGRFDIFVVSS